MRLVPDSCYGGGVVQRKAGLTSPALMEGRHLMLARLSVRGTMRRLLLGVSMLVAVSASAIGMASPAHAVTGVSEIPDRTWNTNGTVFDTELSKDGSTLYIGGKFTRVRENPPGVAGRSFAANNVAAINVATGEAISGWNPNVTGGTSSVRAL